MLYEAINATSVVDAADLAGTAGEGITVSPSNVYQIFGEIAEALDSYNIPQEDRFFIIVPQFKNFLWQYISGKESLLGDRTGETGNIGRYNNMDLYMSNNATGVSRWTPADNPSDEDTITIEGITFTFQSAIGTAAGNILQTTNLATTIDNLFALIDAGGVGDGVNYVSLSTANQRTVQNWVAYDGTTYFEIRIKGTPNPTVSGSVAADTWDAKWEVSNMLAGRKKAIDVAIQIPKGKNGVIVDTQMASTVSAGKRGINIMPLLAGGVKTFYVGKDELVKVKMRTDS